MKMLLNDQWILLDGEKSYACTVPCSVYDTLIRENVIPDPYVGENQWDAFAVSERDYVFEKEFLVPEALLSADRLALVFEGIDTLGEIFLNGTHLGHTDNMHRIWEYQVLDIIRPGINHLRVELASPTRFVREKCAARPLWGVDTTTPGYPYLRKAHCMFGWDWGPSLPDLGIWRDVSLRGFTGGRIREVYYSQAHESGKAFMTSVTSMA